MNMKTRELSMGEKLDFLSMQKEIKAVIYTAQILGIDHTTTGNILKKRP